MTDLLPHEDPKRRCLRVAEWPERDRIAWERALAPGDILDGTIGPGFHWRPQTQEKYRKGYGRWLTFLITSGLLERDIAPGDRLTPNRITLYIEQLTEQDVGNVDHLGSPGRTSLRNQSDLARHRLWLVAPDRPLLREQYRR